MRRVSRAGSAVAAGRVRGHSCKVHGAQLVDRHRASRAAPLLACHIMSLGCPELSPCYSGILVVTPPRQGSSRARWGFFMSGVVKDALTACWGGCPECPTNNRSPFCASVRGFLSHNRGEKRSLPSDTNPWVLRSAIVGKVEWGVPSGAPYSLNSTFPTLLKNG